MFRRFASRRAIAFLLASLMIVTSIDMTSISSMAAEIGDISVTEEAVVSETEDPVAGEETVSGTETLSSEEDQEDEETEETEETEEGGTEDPKDNSLEIVTLDLSKLWKDGNVDLTYYHYIRISEEGYSAEVEVEEGYNDAVKTVLQSGTFDKLVITGTAVVDYGEIVITGMPEGATICLQDLTVYDNYGTFLQVGENVKTQLELAGSVNLWRKYSYGYVNVFDLGKNAELCITGSGDLETNCYLNSYEYAGVFYLGENAKVTTKDYSGDFNLDGTGNSQYLIKGSAGSSFAIDTTGTFELKSGNGNNAVDGLTDFSVNAKSIAISKISGGYLFNTTNISLTAEEDITFNHGSSAPVTCNLTSMECKAGGDILFNLTGEQGQVCTGAASVSLTAGGTVKIRHPEGFTSGAATFSSTSLSIQTGNDFIYEDDIDLFCAGYSNTISITSDNNISINNPTPTSGAFLEITAGGDLKLAGNYFNMSNAISLKAGRDITAEKVGTIASGLLYSSSSTVTLDAGRNITVTNTIDAYSYAIYGKTGVTVQAGGSIAMNVKKCQAVNSSADCSLTAVGNITICGENISAPYIGASKTLTMTSEQGSIDVSANSLGYQMINAGDIKVKAKGDITLTLEKSTNNTPAIYADSYYGTGSMEFDCTGAIRINRSIVSENVVLYGSTINFKNASKLDIKGGVNGTLNAEINGPVTLDAVGNESGTSEVNITKATDVTLKGSSGSCEFLRSLNITATGDVVLENPEGALLNGYKESVIKAKTITVSGNDSYIPYGLINNATLDADEITLFENGKSPLMESDSKLTVSAKKFTANFPITLYDASGNEIDTADRTISWDEKEQKTAILIGGDLAEVSFEEGEDGAVATVSYQGNEIDADTYVQHAVKDAAGTNSMAIEPRSADFAGVILTGSFLREIQVDPASEEDPVAVVSREGKEDIGFTDFVKAWDFASDHSPSTVKLYKDVTIDSADGYSVYTLQLYEDGDLVLDLNGHDVSSNCGGFQVMRDSSLTIRDSSTEGQGTIRSVDYESPQTVYAVTAESGSKLTVEGGILYGIGLNIPEDLTPDADLTISGGTVIAPSKDYPALYIVEGTESEFDLTGGRFIGDVSGTETIVLKTNLLSGQDAATAARLLTKMFPSVYGLKDGDGNFVLSGYTAEMINGRTLALAYTGKDYTIASGRKPISEAGLGELKTRYYDMSGIGNCELTRDLTDPYGLISEEAYIVSMMRYQDSNRYPILDDAEDAYKGYYTFTGVDDYYGSVTKDFYAVDSDWYEYYEDGNRITVDYAVMNTDDLVLDYEWDVSGQKDLAVGDNAVTLVYTRKLGNNDTVYTADITVTREDHAHIYKQYTGATCADCYEECVICNDRRSTGSVCDNKLHSVDWSKADKGTAVVSIICSKCGNIRSTYSVSLTKKTVGNKTTYSHLDYTLGLLAYTVTTYSNGYRIGMEEETRYYTGSAICPEPDVFYNGKALTKGVDYTLSYTNNVNANVAEDGTKVLQGYNKKTKSYYELVPTITIKGKGNYKGTATVTFDINQVDAEEDFDLEMDTWAYTAPKAGKTLSFDYTLYSYMTGKTVKASDYTVKVTTLDGEEQSLKNIPEGIYQLTFAGKNNYYGECYCGTFTVTKAAMMSTAKVTMDKNYNVTKISVGGKNYQKAAITENFNVLIPSGLTKKIPGTYEIRITAKDSLAGVVSSYGAYTKTVTVKGTKKFAKNTFFIPVTGLTYDGTEQLKDVSNNAGLKEGVDYTVTYGSAVKAGKVNVTVTGINEYTGSVKLSYTIGQALITSADVTCNDLSCAYTKAGAKPENIVVTFKGTTLKEGSDYKLSYKNNNKLGTATVTITGIGNFTGSRTLNYTVAAQNVADLEITAADMNYTKQKGYKAAITVKDGNTKCKANTDYTVTYEAAASLVTVDDIVDKGYVLLKATITGKGNYTGSQVVNYRVCTEKLSSLTIKLGSASYAYTGSELRPQVQVLYTVKVGSEKKTYALSSAEYQVTYANNTNVGTAKVTVIGTGKYLGSKTLTFKITQNELKLK